MKVRNVADYLVETLSRTGVNHLYGVVGDSLNGITEAVRQHEDMEWIGVRHEESAAFAASGESQLTGKLAVCAGSCGPGNLHLINGLFDAHRTRTPVLAIAAHIPSIEVGGGYFQETHPQSLFQECSHYCELISEVEQAPYVLESAIRAAVGGQGVSVIVLPGDVALRDAPQRRVISAGGIKLGTPDISPDSASITELADLLNASRRVAIFAGRGCKAAHAELMKLADVLGAPIIHALGGKEYVEHDNPFDIGMTGFIGFSSGYAAMQSCDALLMLGTDFPYKQFLPAQCSVAQVDTRAENLGRRVPIELGIVGDVRRTILQLLPALNRKADRRFLSDALAHYARVRKELDELAVGTPGSKPIHPQYLARVISETATDDAVFTADVGTTTVWAARYLRMNGQRRLIGSFCHGSMANALPQAIGVQYEAPMRQVVTFSGDGGLTMLMGDLITLKQHNLPVKVVVFNNGVLGFVALEMKAAGFLETGVDLENPDFAAMAESLGIRARRVEDPAELAEAASELFAHDGPALLDVVTAKQELVLPPTIGLKEIKGFSLWVLQAIINGRGDAVVDLAKENLLSR
ncbi:Pyruvate dehydrogenase [ubiquinone] [Paraburkholderia hiiakae]|uniref:Pyruvate dehydrogenase [ubiquinone] n=1 Tax=Paraburkholderia hiiakae TaxID=1081782 RepID=A0ABM8NN23_9BURK|nr:ubiquinone-dependent pyruvate dehydrogenase [Paraburkholderia hiiakae]CAD6534264.1 Pyruvate dehydrogenase [ubiquinone] [Paraburkholderia hiiakae]